MGEIKIFKTQGQVKELQAKLIDYERNLQHIIENNMLDFFGVHFLQSEYITSNGGRIDSLGVDEDNCPVIFEYKRSKNENVINQGLFYLDWLLDHQASFQLLVMEKLGNDYSDKVDWSAPRLICIANDFTKYDEYAVNQINRNIDLVRYKLFDGDLLLFELLHTNTAKTIESKSIKNNSNSRKTHDRTFEEKLVSSSDFVKNINEEINDYILSLGDDVQRKQLKFYVAYKKIKNFVCLEVFKDFVRIYLKLDPDEEGIINGFSRDLRNIGHFGTGDYEITINNSDDFEKAKPYIEKSYYKS